MRGETEDPQSDVVDAPYIRAALARIRDRAPGLSHWSSWVRSEPVTVELAPVHEVIQRSPAPNHWIEYEERIARVNDALHERMVELVRRRAEEVERAMLEGLVVTGESWSWDRRGNGDVSLIWEAGVISADEARRLLGLDSQQHLGYDARSVIVAYDASQALDAIAAIGEELDEAQEATE